MTRPRESPSAPEASRSLVKRLLRLMPRRARLHTYPLIGRFAHRLRRHHWLWSFRRNDLRRSYYAGSILAFLPLMGIQLPLATMAALILRCNLMVLGGLQFITNPLSAAPIYYATHQIGEFVLNQVGHHPTPKPRGNELVELAGVVSETLVEETAAPLKLSTRLRSALESLTVGGIILGLSAGGCLDLLDALFRRRRAHSAGPRRHPPTSPHHHGQASPRSADSPQHPAP